MALSGATAGGFFRDIRPVLELVLGTILAVLLGFAALHLAWIATHVGPTVLIIVILGVCYGLYLIRHFFRLAYGMLEIAIGMAAIFGAMGRSPPVVSDPAIANLLLVQTAAGMYLVIRGFDNFAQAAPFGGGFAAFREVWKLLSARWAKGT
jgi:hypothetical protein